MRFFKIIAGAWLLASATATQSWAGQITGIVAFGDSLTDTGNLFAATQSTSPFPPPSSYFAGRFSNGPVYVERLAALLGVPDPTPSLTGGTNYAWGGAETGLSGVSNRGTPNIGTQISTYLAAHPTADPNRLYVVFGGANDFLNSGQTNASIPVMNLAAEITTLYNAGARQFLVPNLPLLGLVPRFVGTANEATFDALTLSFNSQLATALNTLNADPGITIHRLDTYSLFNQIVANPASFGFTNTTGSALVVPGGGVGTGTQLPNPDQYVFWDDIHPTRVSHQLIGNAAFAVVPEPSSVVLLISAGVCLLGSCRARRGLGRPIGDGAPSPRCRKAG